MRLVGILVLTNLLMIAPANSQSTGSFCPIKEFISVCVQNSKSTSALHSAAIQNGWEWNRRRGTDDTYGWVTLKISKDIQLEVSHQNYSGMESISCTLTNPVLIMRDPKVFSCGDLSEPIAQMLPIFPKPKSDKGGEWSKLTYMYESANQNVTMEIATPNPNTKTVGVIMMLNKIVFKGTK